MWSSTDANSIVISSASTTMINHLRDCTRQPNNIREQAREKNMKSSITRKRGNDDGQYDTEGDSPVANRYSHPSQGNFAGIPMIPPPQFTPFASASASSSARQLEGAYSQNYWCPPTTSGPGMQPSSESQPINIPSIRTSLVDRRRQSFSSASRYEPYLSSRPPSTDHGGSFTGSHHNTTPDLPSRSPSVGPMDSVSAVGSVSYSQGAYSQGVVQRQASFKSRDRRRASSTAMQPWSDDKKKRWERLLIHLTASANFPLMWVQNPVWHTILDEFLPQAPRISRKVLTRRLLRDAAADLRAKAKIAVQGKQVTMQADGWTGINHHHLIAFMVTCDKMVLFHSDSESSNWYSYI